MHWLHSIKYPSNVASGFRHAVGQSPHGCCHREREHAHPLGIRNWGRGKHKLHCQRIQRDSAVDGMHDISCFALPRSQYFAGAKFL